MRFPAVFLFPGHANPSRPPSFRGRALLPPTLVVAPDLLVPAHGHLHRRADRRMSRLTSRVVLF